MDDRPFNLNNLRRAADERRKAAAALTEGARRTHLDLAEIFEARAGLLPTPADSSNVIQLQTKAARARRARAAPSVSGTRRRPARG